MSEPKAEPQGGAKLLIDLGPLLVFFLVNFLAPVPVGHEDLRRHRRLHGRDGRGDALLGDPLSPHLAAAVVLRRSWS